MPKVKKDLPLLIIKDTEKDSEARYISASYVRTALQGLLIAHLNGESTQTAIEKLIAEIDATYD